MMIRGFVAFIGCGILAMLWLWLTGDRIMAAFLGGIGSGVWLFEIVRNEPEWDP